MTLMRKIQLWLLRKWMKRQQRRLIIQLAETRLAKLRLGGTLTDCDYSAMAYGLALKKRKG